MQGISELIIPVAVSAWIVLFLKLQWDRRSLPPGPIPFPFIGSLWHFPLPLENYFSKLGETYGKVSTLWLGHSPVIVLSGFRAVRDGLFTHSEDLSGRGTSPIFDDMLKNRGILFSNGNTWKQQRRFGITVLRKLCVGKSVIELQVQEQASQLVAYFSLQKGKPLDPWEYLLHSVSNVISAVILGHGFSFGDKKSQELFNSLDCLIQFTASPFYLLSFTLPKWICRIVGSPRKPANALKTAITFAKEEVTNHGKNRCSENPQDFIDYYLNQMEESKDDPTTTYTEGNMITSILDFIGAGTDTTAVTLYWALLYMAAYPNIQAKVQKELDDVLGPSHVICYKDRVKLPYMLAVIHEVLRFSTIISITFRQCTKDAIVQGVLLKKGTRVVADLRSAMFDSKYWKTPHQFNPHHFLDEDGNFVNQEAFIPFSVGHRVCVGEWLARMELFIVFGSLLQALTFRAPEGVQEMNLTREVNGFVMRPQPYTICAIPR